MNISRVIECTRVESAKVFKRCINYQEWLRLHILQNFRVHIFNLQNDQFSKQNLPLLITNSQYIAYL